MEISYQFRNFDEGERRFREHADPRLENLTRQYERIENLRVTVTGQRNWRTTLSMADLADERLLLLADGHCMREQALDVCHLSGASEKGEFQATSLETLRQMVAADVGVTLLPTLAVKPPVARSENIHLVRFRDPPPSRRIAMVWRRSSAMTDFLEQLSDMLRQLPQDLLVPAADVGSLHAYVPGAAGA